MSKPASSTPNREDAEKELDASEKYFDISVNSGDPGDATLPNDDQSMKSAEEDSKKANEEDANEEGNKLSLIHI